MSYVVITALQKYLNCQPNIHNLYIHGSILQTTGHVRSLNATGCSTASWSFVPVHHHHHHRISVMELDHLLTRSVLTYPEVSSKVYHDSFYQSGSSISLLWVICFEAFYLHVVSSLSCSCSFVPF